MDQTDGDYWKDGRFFKTGLWSSTAVFWNHALAFDQQIFPDSSKEEVYDFVYDIDAVSVQVVHYYHQGQLIGQNIIPILKLALNGKPILVVSSRAGILPAYRKRNRALNSALRIVFNQRIRHPSIPLWFVPTVIQPKIYTYWLRVHVTSFHVLEGKYLLNI